MVEFHLELQLNNSVIIRHKRRRSIIPIRRVVDDVASMKLSNHREEQHFTVKSETQKYGYGITDAGRGHIVITAKSDKGGYLNAETIAGCPLRLAFVC